MDSTKAGFIGGVIGAIAGVLGSLGLGYLQMETAKERAKIEGEIAAKGELRREFRGVARNVLLLQYSAHQACLSVARNSDNPYLPTLADIQAEKVEATAGLLAAMAGVASLNRDLHDGLEPLVAKLYELDRDFVQVMSSGPSSDGSYSKELETVCERTESQLRANNVAAQLAELWTGSVGNEQH